jgi:hypothetical protein
LQEIDFTRRLGAFAPRRLRQLTSGERWFAQTGAVIIASRSGEVAPTGDDLLEAFINLATDCDWQFGQILTADEDSTWTALSKHFGTPATSLDEVEPDQVPLLIATRPPIDSASWRDARRRRGSRASWSSLATRAGHRCGRRIGTTSECSRRRSPNGTQAGLHTNQIAHQTGSHLGP